MGASMTTKQTGDKRSGEKRAEQKPSEAGLLEGVVRDNVLGQLGRPPAPHRIQVTSVGGGSYRVNVFVGLDVASFKIAHTFFVKADADGKILTSTPAVTRAY